MEPEGMAGWAGTEGEGGSSLKSAVQKRKPGLLPPVFIASIRKKTMGFGKKAAKRVGENSYLIFILLLIFCLYQYGIQKIYGFTIYPDEFGYWANAADAVGYDWSQIASVGAYYSFGYSLILIPVLKIFKGGVAAYRAAVAVNMLLMCISIFLLHGIAGKLFPDMGKVRKVFLGGVAVLYPPCIFYMQMTMTEVLLCFLFLLVFYLLLSFLEKADGLGAIALTIALAIALVYMYCVHMRTIGIVIACGLVCFLWGMINKGKVKQILVLAGVFALSAVVAYLLKSHAVSEVFSYAEEDILSKTTYGGQWEKLAHIFTMQGICQFLQEIIGKLFYLGLSSFGLCYWALIWCVRECADLVNRRKRKEAVLPKQWGAVFLLLAAIGEVLISSIFMHQSPKVDGLIYGRYQEMLVPVMIMIGSAFMEKTGKYVVPVIMSMGGILGAMAWMLHKTVEERGLEGLRGYHVPGISYVVNENNPDMELFFRDTWLLGFGMMIFACIIVYMSAKRGYEWLLSFILIMEILAGVQISAHYTYRGNRVNFESLMISDTIRELGKETDKVAYLEEGRPELAGFLQMQMPDRTIHMIKPEALENGKEKARFVISGIETANREQLKEQYEKEVATGTFYLYFDISEDDL